MLVRGIGFPRTSIGIQTAPRKYIMERARISGTSSKGVKRATWERGEGGKGEEEEMGKVEGGWKRRKRLVLEKK